LFHCGKKSCDFIKLKTTFKPLFYRSLSSFLTTVTKMELPVVYFALRQDVWQLLLWLKEWQQKEEKRLARQLVIGFD